MSIFFRHRENGKEWCVCSAQAKRRHNRTVLENFFSLSLLFSLFFSCGSHAAAIHPHTVSHSINFHLSCGDEYRRWSFCDAMVSTHARTPNEKKQKQNVINEMPRCDKKQIFECYQFNLFEDDDVEDSHDNRRWNDGNGEGDNYFVCAFLSLILYGS